MKFLPFLFFLLLPEFVEAQQDVVDYKSKNNNQFRIIGFSMSAGAQHFELKELNNTLQKLKAPTLEADAGLTELRLDMGNEVIMGGIYLNQIEIFQNKGFDLSASHYNFSRINGYYLGFDFSRNLLNKKRWHINFPSAGVTNSFFTLKLDSISKNQVVSVFNSGSNPSPKLNFQSLQNLNIRAGAEFYYKTEWFKKHIYDFRFGIRAGYILPVINNSWQLTNTNTAVPDLPVIDKGSYYLMFQIIGVMLELKDKNN